MRRLIEPSHLDLRCLIFSLSTSHVIVFPSGSLFNIKKPMCSIHGYFWSSRYNCYVFCHLSPGRPSQGGTCFLVPLKKSAFSLVPQNQNFDFSMFPVPQNRLCFLFPLVLDFCSLWFPWNKWPYSPVLPNPWVGLTTETTYVTLCAFLHASSLLKRGLL